MLQVQDVSVEVGGRFVVEDVSFTVMPRDKVGLVGRNGAGKTSLFKVLGGAVEPTDGKILRKGGFGYLPQDPRIDRRARGPAGRHPRAVGPSASTRRWIRIEKLRMSMEEDAERAQRRPLQPRAGRVRLVGRLRGRERGAQHRRRPRV